MTVKHQPQDIVAENSSAFHVEADRKTAGPSRGGKRCPIRGNPPKKSSQTRQNFPPTAPEPEKFSASDPADQALVEPQDVDSTALYQAARARRMHYEAEASRMRAEVMSGRLVPRALLDELVGELGRRLDALTHRLDSAYGQGPAACVPECLAGIDEWLAARIEEYALRMAITPTNRV